MLSACSWEGTALQLKQLAADVHCARPHSQAPASASFPAPRGRGDGRRRGQDRCILSPAPRAATAGCWPRQTGIFWKKPKWAG